MTNLNTRSTTENSLNTKDSGLFSSLMHILEGIAAPARLRNAQSNIPHWQAD